MSAALFYAVIQTDTDGTVTLWGPFTPHRADLAVAALEMLDGVENARALPLLNSSVLSREVPDWKRVVALAALCEERGYPIPAVHSKTEASLLIDEIRRGAYRPPEWDDEDVPF